MTQSHRRAKVHFLSTSLESSFLICNGTRDAARMRNCYIWSTVHETLKDMHRLIF